MSRDRILDVAERVATQQGTAALTMRRLGSVLGVDHTAVYRHFRDKEALLAAVVDRMLERQAAPEPDRDWREAFKRGLRHAFARYDLHPDLAELVALRPSSTETVAALMERVLASLRNAGLSIEQSAALYQVTECYVAGFGLYSSLIKWGVKEGKTLDFAEERRALGALAPDQFPHVVAAASHLCQEPETVFEWASDLLLDAVEHLSQRPQTEEVNDAES